MNKCIAAKPFYYVIHPKECAIVDVEGTEVVYKGTIRALDDAPKGARTGSASSDGAHPFVCEACDSHQFLCYVILPHLPLFVSLTAIAH